MTQFEYDTSAAQIMKRARWIRLRIHQGEAGDVIIRQVIIRLPDTEGPGGINSGGMAGKQETGKKE